MNSGAAFISYTLAAGICFIKGLVVLSGRKDV